MFDPDDKISGGQGFIYASSIVVAMKKLKLKEDEDGNKISEVKGIMESYTSFRLHLWSFDTDVFNPVVFTPENLDDIMEWSPGGGGGTSFEANWEFMRDNDIVPKKFVMFTDGYPGNGWGDEEYCDTLFIIHGSTTIEAPFGITAYYELSKEYA
jgi:predicted metal-dependent peptidase